MYIYIYTYIYMYVLYCKICLYIMYQSHSSIITNNSNIVFFLYIHVLYMYKNDVCIS